MIPDEQVERVREAADIVVIIGEYVELRRTGTDYRAPCPFHQGTHRNFSVSPKRGIYYCFVCHEGGDVFSFLQKRLGVDWPSAVRMVAERVGIEIREIKRNDREGPDPREPMWEVNAAAAEYFQKQLWDEKGGEPAREYLASRGITQEEAAKFALGFSPRDGAALRGYLTTLGFTDKRQLEVGLLVLREGETEPRTRFRGRLMFPIRDIQGRVIAFGGRVIGVGEPKYLNSPETPLFSKGKTLYGLDTARNEIRREDRVLVVEGYFDCVRIALAGVETVVAPLGTALTEEQGALLLRYTKNVFLLYDSDMAGLKATFRAGDALLAQGAAVQVATLPEGEDPDSFVRRHGSAGLEKLLAGAIDVFERKVQILERGGWFSDLRRKRQALDRLLPTIRLTQDALTRDIYLSRAAEVVGVGREILEREMLAAPKRGRGGREAAAAEAAPHPGEAPHEPRARKGGDRRTRYAVRAHSAERELVRVALHLRQYVERIAERIGDDTFREPHFAAIFAELLSSGGEATNDELAAVLDEETVIVLQGLLDEPGGLDVADLGVERSLAALKARSLDEQLQELDQQLAAAQPAEQDSLLTRKNAMAKELRLLDAPRWKAFGSSRP
ncbi:MAG: primase [Gemmatimonadetes bacterium]|nr:primase [Gemmatimonadota bacterium]